MRIIKNLIYKISPSPLAWRGAAIGTIIATLLICLVSTFDLISKGVSLSDASLYFFAGSIIIALIGAIIVLVWLSFSPLPILYKWALACFAFIVYYFFIPSQTPLGISLIALWCLLSFSFIGGAIYTLIKEKSTDWVSQAIRWVCLIIGLASLAFLWFWLNQSNQPYQPSSVKPIIQKIDRINLPDPSAQGPFSFKSLTYGHSKQPLTTSPIDGSHFVGGWNGLEGWLRTRYWGFNVTELPLNGKIYSPDGEGPYPLILIVHGNHEMSAASDQGYIYLGELLASHGFITASIDENFLNDSWMNVVQGLDDLVARGWLILEHLKLWRQWNETQDHPFFQKVDMSNIGLIGHSRGGEAIAIAKILNPLNRYPGNGNIEFDYDFDIRALAAIAPIDGQFTLNGNKLALKNVDYLVMHGSHDGDIRSFEGAAQYHRIHFTDDDYHFKTALYILGANHGQFNTIWGKKDVSPPVSAFFELGSIMPAEEQQRIAQVYLTAFFNASLKQDKGYLSLFRNYRTGQQWLPQTDYFNEFADSTFQYIDKERESLDLTKISLAGGTSIGENLDIWRQGEIVLKNGTNLGAGTFLGWTFQPENPIPSYILTLSEKNTLEILPESYLALTIANADYTEDNPIDFTIILTDIQNNSSKLALSEYADIQPPATPAIMKAPFLDPFYQPEYIFQSILFPLKDFIAKNPALNPSQLKNIVLQFDKTPSGLIILDSIALGHID